MIFEIQSRTRSGTSTRACHGACPRPVPLPEPKRRGGASHRYRSRRRPAHGHGTAYACRYAHIYASGWISVGRARGISAGLPLVLCPSVAELPLHRRGRRRACPRGHRGSPNAPRLERGGPAPHGPARIAPFRCSSRLAHARGAWLRMPCVRVISFASLGEPQLGFLPHFASGLCCFC